MSKKKSPDSVRLRNSTAEFLIFAYQTGGDGVEVRVEDQTIWLSQKNMGQLFETTPENVLMHLKNIFADKELEEDSVAKVFLATAADGKNYKIKHYHLFSGRMEYPIINTESSNFNRCDHGSPPLGLRQQGRAWRRNYQSIRR